MWSGKFTARDGIKRCNVLIIGDKKTPEDDAEKRSKSNFWIEVNQQDSLQWDDTLTRI